MATRMPQRTSLSTMRLPVSNFGVSPCIAKLAREVAIAFTFIGGVVIGAAGIQSLSAQVKGPRAYYVAETTDVSDQAGFVKAIQDIVPANKAHGARYLALAGKTSAVEGQPPKRVAILSFDSFDQAQKWFQSSEYAPHAAAIDKVAKVRSYIIEGTAR
jgi:uncharacterized protein (DUF1330 family)